MKRCQTLALVALALCVGMFCQLLFPLRLLLFIAAILILFLALIVLRF